MTSMWLTQDELVPDTPENELVPANKLDTPENELVPATKLDNPENELVPANK